MADRTFLSWPFFDDAHRELAGAFDSWAARTLAPVAAEHAQAETQDAIDHAMRRYISLLAEGGWLKHVVPAAYGGARDTMDVRSICLMRETLARYDGLADFALAMQGLGSGAITLFGTDALKREWLPKVRDGRAIAAFAISEKDAGSDVSAMSTRARRDGGDWVIDGEKTWISNAGIADFYVVFAGVAREGAGKPAFVALVVPAGTKGLTITERIPTVAPHPLGTLRFENCRVPAGHLVGNEGDGLKHALATLDVFRSTVGAAALGFARRALDEAVSFSASRRVGNSTLADQQIAQAMLAGMATRVDASALLVYRAAWTKDVVQGRVTREAAMAKMFATESAQRVIDDAVQLLGARGVVAGSPVERLYREIRALRIYEGTTQIQQLVIAGQLLKEHSSSTSGGAHAERK